MLTTRPLLFSVFTLAACAPAPIIIEGVSLQMNPNESAPLAAVLGYTSDRPVRARLTLNHEGDEELSIELSSFAQRGPVPVLGVRSEREYAVSVSFESEDGVVAPGGEFTLSTPPLPEDFPPYEVTTLRPVHMEPGYHFIPVMRWRDGQPDREYGMIFALDAAGEVVWFYRPDRSVADVKRLPNGDLIYLAGRDGRMVQIDKLGHVVRHWHTTGIPKDDVPEGSIPVDCDTFHHDFLVMPNDNFLALSTEARRFEEWASSEDDPDAPLEPTTVIGDVLVEFSPNGEVQRRWHLLDILDPHRISHGSLSKGFWRKIYKDVLEEAGVDWAHTNSVDYDPSSDSVVLSLNHQSAVFKMSLEDSSIQWILGDHGSWNEPWSDHLLEPSGELLWPSKQHAAEITSSDTILLFDNGGHRAPPFTPHPKGQKRYSRAVEYRIDQAAGTAEETWSYGNPDTEYFFSSFLCDADLMPTTGNVIVTDGARVHPKGGGKDDGPGADHHWAHIFEIDRETRRKVFEMSIEGEDGWAVYRSERFSTLY